MKPSTAKPEPHPGEYLRVFIENRKLTQEKVAELIGTTRANLVSILGGKRAISPAMALKLASAFWRPALWWLYRQADYDLAQEQKKREALL